MMKKIQSRANKINRKHGLEDPRYSFDNATIHKMEELEGLALDWNDRVELPAKSPDMHKVIEHVFGTLETAMQEALHDDPSLSRGHQYAALLRDLFKNLITPDSVQKDIMSLYPLYRMLSRSKNAGGVGGDWPPARFR